MESQELDMEHLRKAKVYGKQSTQVVRSMKLYASENFVHNS